MSEHGDFESLARHLKKSGIEASSPATLSGRSGASHEFAFAAHLMSGDSLVVVDTALAMTEVEELQVLSFYAKVFDITPEYALLCVSPRLGSKGKRLASEYNISVFENEIPKRLVPMVAKYLDTLVAQMKLKRKARARRSRR